MERTVQIFKDFITQKIEKATLSIEETERQIEEVKSIKKAIENSKASNNTCNIASPSELMIKYSLEDIVREFNLFRSITNYSYSDIISFLEMKKALGSIDIINTRSCLRGDLGKLFRLLAAIRKVENKRDLERLLESKTDVPLYFLQHFEFQIYTVLDAISKNYSKVTKIGLAKFCDRIENVLNELLPLSIDK